MAERPDYTRRVDEVFARAVEEQLSEQRELTQLITRVDEALIALRDGMATLSDRVVDTTTPVAESVTQTRTSLLSGLERLRESTTADREAFAAQVTRRLTCLLYTSPSPRDRG